MLPFITMVVWAAVVVVVLLVACATGIKRIKVSWGSARLSVERESTSAQRSSPSTIPAKTSQPAVDPPPRHKPKPSASSTDKPMSELIPELADIDSAYGAIKFQDPTYRAAFMNVLMRHTEEDDTLVIVDKTPE